MTFILWCILLVLCWPLALLALVLYPFVAGYTGNSSFRYDTTNNQFIFNWDTTVSDGAGCYTLTLQLDDGSAPKATSLQLK